MEEEVTNGETEKGMGLLFELSRLDLESQSIDMGIVGGWRYGQARRTLCRSDHHPLLLHLCPVTLRLYWGYLGGGGQMMDLMLAACQLLGLAT